MQHHDSSGFEKVTRDCHTTFVRKLKMMKAIPTFEFFTFTTKYRLRCEYVLAMALGYAIFLQ
jgi:hypothetical protein